MKSTEKQYRYPGTRPFTEDDRLLFFGRNEDIERLHEQILVEKLVVLFGKSGLGKSSLLNAGVVPLLKEQDNFLAIPMILGFARAENISPAEFFLNKVAKLVDYNTILWTKIANEHKETWTDATLDECFWLACKSLQLQQPQQPIIFVLDQFEEIFTENTLHINRFAYLLATILNGQTPQKIKNSVIEKQKNDKNTFTKQEITVLFEPLDIKFVISTRSDKLSLLSRLKNYVPQILQKTYELHPLSIEQAKDALLNPAKADGDFVSPAFTYQKQAEETIINYLSTNQTKQIETFQLQLICQFCENVVLKSNNNFPKVSNFREVKVNDLGDLATIFTRHYDTLIHEITDVNEQLAVRKLIEENMIIEGNRVPLPDKVITSKHNISAVLLQQLVNSRLLRSEPNTVGGYSFEISHDTLVQPITTSYKIRFEKEERERLEKEKAEREKAEREKAEKEKAEREKELQRQRKIITIVSVAAVVAIVLAVFGFVMWQRAKEQKKIVETTKINLQIEKLRVDSALAVSQKLVDAFYFYDNKFGLAYKYNKFYFIDKQGNEVVKLGKWKKAEQFNEYGYAKVIDDSIEFIIDTLGNKYRFASNLVDLNNEIEAFNFSNQEIKRIPQKILNNTQLKILWLNNNQLTTLPPEIEKLTNLTELDLGFNELPSLPQEIGKLTNLTKLDLKYNPITALPPEIGKLTNLTMMDLELIQLNVLPPEIGKLTNLTTLDLSGNHLSV